MDNGQADHFFSQGSYELAAKYYGKTTKQFEEVCLQFIDKNERDALKTFLLNKLDNLKPSVTHSNTNPMSSAWSMKRANQGIDCVVCVCHWWCTCSQEPTQRTIVCTWLVEIYLSKLNNLKV